MTRAYDKEYLPLGQEHLGEMFDFGCRVLGFPAEELFGYFISSGIASKIEECHPGYIAGRSGAELALMVLESTGLKSECPAQAYLEYGIEYWTGWVLAYLQWYSGLSFRSLRRIGISAHRVESLYHPLHEADISKVCDVVLPHTSPLREFRRSLGMSQAQLAGCSGVSLRMIRAYEQGSQDISRAEASTLLHLAKALDCPPEELLITF